MHVEYLREHDADDLQLVEAPSRNTPGASHRLRPIGGSSGVRQQHHELVAAAPARELADRGAPCWEVGPGDRLLTPAPPGSSAPQDYRRCYNPVMSDRARKVLVDAMELPIAERAELAADLLASLDGEPDSDVEAAWSREIERRAKEALANSDDDIAWEVVRAELHAVPPR